MDVDFFVFYFPTPMKTYKPSYDTEYHTNQCNKVTTLKIICQMCSKESNKSIICAIVNKFSIFHPPLLCELQSMTKVLDKSFSFFPFVRAYRFISTFCFVCALLFDRHIWRFVYQIPNKTHTHKTGERKLERAHERTIEDIYGKFFVECNKCRKQTMFYIRNHTSTKTL